MIDFHAHTAYRHNVSIIVSSCQHYNDQPHNIYSHILALQKATRKPRFHLVGNCIIEFFYYVGLIRFLYILYCKCCSGGLCYFNDVI